MWHSQAVYCRWIRVVHSGYGNAVWHEDLRASNLTFVAASAHPEGCYVRGEDVDVTPRSFGT